MYGKLKWGYLLRDYIDMSCLKTGEIKIGINAKRKRMGKLVSMESVERRQSKMHYKFFGGWGGGSCVTPLPNNVGFSQNTDCCCGVEPIAYFPLVLRLAVHRTYIFQLKSYGVFFPDVGFVKEGTNKI
jgi:hypothetical protein